MVLTVNGEEEKAGLARKLLSATKKANKPLIYLTIVLIILTFALLIITIFPLPKIIAFFNEILDHISCSPPK